MKLRLIIRGFAAGVKVFEDRVEVGESELDTLLPQLAEKHAEALAGERLHMVEVEFLDEPDERERFFRFGSDPRGMVLPVEIPL